MLQCNTTTSNIDIVSTKWRILSLQVMVITYYLQLHVFSRNQRREANVLKHDFIFPYLLRILCYILF